MKNLIPVLRTRRLLEMQQCQEKGYQIQDKKHYLMLEKVQLRYMDTDYEYRVQVTQDELYFYICRDDANMYLSIAEIYDMLVSLPEEKREAFVNSMKKQLRQRTTIYLEILNHGLTYKMMHPVALDREFTIDVPQTGIQITNRELFLLMILIQTKSNELFRRSTGKKRLYVNGIFRMLVVLLEYQSEDTLLESLGWSWDEKLKRYVFVSKDSRRGREKFKYYLTKKEYDARLNAKKS